MIVVNAVDKDRKSVLVHCSDGWDRTPQIVALAELLLDPYYRTVEVRSFVLISTLGSAELAGHSIAELIT